MKKREIETYMDAYMEGFWSCYCTMIDLIEDDEPSQEEVKDSQEIVEDSRKTTQELSEKPPVVPKPSKPKDEPKASKNDPRQAKKEPPTHEDYVALFNKGKLPTEVAKELNVSPQTAYNHLYKAKQAGELK